MPSQYLIALLALEHSVRFNFTCAPYFALVQRILEKCAPEADSLKVHIKSAKGLSRKFGAVYLYFGLKMNS